MTTARADICVALLAVASCYAPHAPDGAPCAEDRTCPSGQTCTFGICSESTPPCIPIDSGAGKLTIPKLRESVVVDGDLADWPTCFITVDATTAGLVRDLGADGHYAPGRFSIAADDDRLYVAAEVTIVPPLGDQPLPAIYKNNAISVYFDGDGVFDQMAYGSDGAQIVVDHANREQAFHSPGGSIPLPDVTSAATVGPTTFTIEMSVSAASFGLVSFATTIGFDIGLVGGDGSVMTSELVWYQACAPPACGCTSDAAPYCDARELGTATFAPAP